MKRISAHPLRVLGPVGFMLALLLAGTSATAVTIDLGSASGQVGDTVLLPVEVTGLVEDVRAFELDIRWSTTYAQCVGVTTTGTLTAGWSVFHSPGAGTVSVAGAAAGPLAGDGTLVLLEFLLGPNASNVTVYLDAATLNEGDPVPTLANGLLSITALPTVDIYPDTGVIAVGDSFQMYASGGTAPHTFSSSDPLVADFAGGSLLYGLAPGFVQATAEDQNGFTGTTTGSIEVRAFKLRVVNTTVTEGETALVPIELDDPAGYGIVAGEFTLTWYAPYGEFVGIETAGTLMEEAGWSAPTFSATTGRLTIAGAGTTALSGPGVFVYARFLPSNNLTLTIADNMFNEVYPALPVNGTVFRTALPTIWISPGTGNLRVGDQLQFTAYGSPTAPVTWSVDDPAVANIDAPGRPAGLLTATSEGVVRVYAVDDVGATAVTGLINVYGLGLPAISSSIGADEVVMVPVTVDRTLDDLNLYSYEVAVDYSPAHVQFLAIVTAGTVSSTWGAPTVVDDGGTVRVYHAGATKLTDCNPALFFVMFQGLPGLVSPYTGVSLDSALFNEGTPRVLINAGVTCENISAVPPAYGGLRLWPNQPNPFNPSTTVRFTLEQDGQVDLAVYSARGERVRQLVSGWRAAGPVHAVVWDGRDDNGRVQASGVYYCRLQSGAQSVLEKMVLLK